LRLRAARRRPPPLRSRAVRAGYARPAKRARAWRPRLLRQAEPRGHLARRRRLRQRPAHRNVRADRQPFGSLVRAPLRRRAPSLTGARGARGPLRGPRHGTPMTGRTLLATALLAVAISSPAVGATASRHAAVRVTFVGDSVAASIEYVPQAQAQLGHGLSV